MAARRDDVMRLVSMAGNMHPDVWTPRLGLTRLSGDSPVNHIAALQALPQLLMLI